MHPIIAVILKFLRISTLLQKRIRLRCIWQNILKPKVHSKSSTSSPNSCTENFSLFYFIFSFISLPFFCNLCKVYSKKSAHKVCTQEDIREHTCINIHVVSFHYTYSTSRRKIGWFFNEKKNSTQVFLKVKKNSILCFWKK